MRDQLLTLVKALPLGTFRVSSELPYTNSGVELYTKNAKTIYVDTPDIEVTTFLANLDSVNIDQTTTTVQVYFTSDAKQQATNLDTLVAGIRALKDNSAFTGFNTRECVYTVDYANDTIVSEFEFRFTQIS
tara:strand:+ start:2015 stop:2407 length:393 start_codon:yes stop_codon:yes gene_type:complete